MKRIIYGIFILVLIMVNPPVMGMVNEYAYMNPITFGWPTIIVWLDFWYIVAVIAFIAGAFLIESWQRDYKEI
jgi:uncharacterized integral membrane protein